VRSLPGDAIFARQCRDAIRKLRREVAGPKALRVRQRPLRCERAERGKLCGRVLFAAGQRVGQAEPKTDRGGARPLRRAVFKQTNGLVDLADLAIIFEWLGDPRLAPTFTRQASKSYGQRFRRTPGGNTAAKCRQSAAL